MRLAENLWFQVFVALATVATAITTYNQISEVMGQAIVSVLLGQAQPKEALDSAAQQVDAILAGQ